MKKYINEELQKYLVLSSGYWRFLRLNVLDYTKREIT